MNVKKNPYTLLVEAYRGTTPDSQRFSDTSDKTVRLIVFERDPDSEAMSVNDIVEITLGADETKHNSRINYLFGFVAHHFADGCDFHEHHANVDFGRVRTDASRLAKIVKSLLWDLDHPDEVAARELHERQLALHNYREQRTRELCEELASLHPANGIDYDGEKFTVELRWK